MTSPDANSDRCFVCGSRNPIGLKLDFEIRDGVCRASFTPGDNHIGWDRVVHGGILFAALDDVMANWLYLQGVHGYTARCDLRFRRPVTVGTALTLIGRPRQQRGQMVSMLAQAVDAVDGSVYAECEARFMIPPDSTQTVAGLLAELAAAGD